MDWKEIKVGHHTRWQSDTGWSVSSIAQPTKFCALSPNGAVMGYSNSPIKAKKICEDTAPALETRSKPAVPLEDIVSEWVTENTQLDDWTYEQLVDIALLIVKFTREGVVG